MTKQDAQRIVGGLSSPSKMPCKGYSIPATQCNVGGKLRLRKGTICSKCYARKGRYMFQNVRLATGRRYVKVLRALSSDAERARFVAAFVTLLKGETFFRWHDSGDLQSPEHLELIVAIAEATPHVQHWLPTKEYAIVRSYPKPFPPNLTVRISVPLIDGDMPRIHGLAKSAAYTTTPQAGYHDCPTKQFGGTCGPCRMCWEGKDVTIKVH